MKQFYILYNPSMEEYYFSTTLDPYSNGGRKRIHEEELLEFIKSNVNIKRNSLLTLLNVKDDTAEKIKNLFKNSKISVQNKKR